MDNEGLTVAGRCATLPQNASFAVWDGSTPLDPEFVGDTRIEPCGGANLGLNPSAGGLGVLFIGEATGPNKYVRPGDTLVKFDASQNCLIVTPDEFERGFMVFPEVEGDGRDDSEDPVVSEVDRTYEECMEALEPFEEGGGVYVLLLSADDDMRQASVPLYSGGGALERMVGMCETFKIKLVQKLLNSGGIAG